MLLMFLKTGAGITLLAGAIVMAVNVVRYHRLLGRHRHLKHSGPDGLRYIFSLNLGLLENEEVHQIVGTSKRLVCYHPENGDSWISLTDFLEDFFRAAAVELE